MVTSVKQLTPEQLKYKHARRNYISQKTDSVAIGVDAVDIGAVFSLTVQATLHQFLEQTGKYFLFPIAALINIFRAIVSWRDAAANKGKNGTAYNAFVETVAAVGITTAVVGGLVFNYLFANITPIIFAGVMAFKTVANGLAAAFYLGKSFAVTDPAEKLANRQKATLYAAATTATLLAGIAVTGVMILLHQYVSIVGMVGAAVGVFAAIYKWQHSKKPAKPASINNAQDQDDYDVDYEQDEGIKHVPKLSQQARVSSTLKQGLLSKHGHTNDSQLEGSWKKAGELTQPLLTTEVSDKRIYRNKFTKFVMPTTAEKETQTANMDQQQDAIASQKGNRM